MAVANSVVKKNHTEDTTVDIPTVLCTKPKSIRIKPIKVIFPAGHRERCPRKAWKKQQVVRLLLSRSIMVSLIIFALVLLQNKFLTNLENDLLAIKQATLMELKGMETEKTPIIIVVDRNKLKTGTIDKVAGAYDVEGDTTATRLTLSDGAMNTTDATARLTNENLMNGDSNKATTEKVTNDKNDGNTKSFTITPLTKELGDSYYDNDLKDLSMHKDTNVIDNMKNDAVFKIYGYIYMFYIAVTILIICNFMILRNLFLAKKAF